MITNKGWEMEASFTSFKIRSHCSGYGGCETSLVTGKEDKSSFGLNPVQQQRDDEIEHFKTKLCTRQQAVPNEQILHQNFKLCLVMYMQEQFYIKTIFLNFFLVTESEGNSIFSAEICTAFFFFFFFSKERRKVSQKWHLVKIRRAAGSRDARSGISSQISPIVLKPVMRL